MQISQALSDLEKGKSIAIAGKTFAPTLIDEVKMKSGETMYWIRDGGDVWLSLDPASDEVILFVGIEVELDLEEDTVVYSGEDYEFYYEDEGTLYEEGEEIDKIHFRDYEGGDGQVMRVASYSVNNEVLSSLGQKVPEEDLQPV